MGIVLSCLEEQDRHKYESRNDHLPVSSFHAAPFFMLSAILAIPGTNFHEMPLILI
jgi:hypothetical protein